VFALDVEGRGEGGRKGGRTDRETGTSGEGGKRTRKFEAVRAGRKEREVLSLYQEADAQEKRGKG